MADQLTKDYTHLEGKSYPTKGNISIPSVYIVGIDYDIGITIVNDSDREEYIQCLTGPTAFKTKFGKEHTNLEDYNKRFLEIVSVLEQGFYDYDIMLAGLERSLTLSQQMQRTIRKTVTISPESCPFNQ